MAVKPTYDELLQKIKELEVSLSSCRISESALARKSKVDFESDDEDADFTFRDLFELGNIQKLQNDFASATGIASVITDPQGIPITEPVNFTRLCTHIISLNSNGICGCNKSAERIDDSLVTGPIVQRCQYTGLWTGAVRITVGGNHLANWLFGQVRDSNLSSEEVKAYADEKGIDYELFASAHEEIPLMDLKRFQLVGQAVFTLANQLSHIAWQNLIHQKIIAEHKLTETALKEAQVIINRSPAVAFLWKNEEGWPVEYVSTNVHELFGYSSEEFMDGTVSYAGLIHPKDIERVTSEVQRFSTTSGLNSFVHAPYRIIKKDGSIRYVDDRTYIKRDHSGKITHFGGVVLDISERMEADFALRKSEKQYRNLFENLVDVYTRADANGHIVLASPSVTTLLGYTPEEVVGKHYSTFYADSQEVSRLHEYLNHDGFVKNFETRLVKKDGSVAWVSMSGKLIYNDENEIIGSELLTRDVSSIKSIEIEKQNIESQLGQSRKMEAIGTLAGGIAHDFNNILSPMVGYAELIQEDLPPDSPVAEKVDEILTAALRAKDLVKQILEFSRHEESEAVPVKLGPVVKEAVKLLRSSIPASVKVVSEIDEVSGKVVIAPTHVYQIVMNLATNANFAMEDKGGELTVVLEEIPAADCKDRFLTTEFDSKGAEKFIRLTVADTGEGIPKAVLDRVREPYFTTRATGKGTGMGLSVIDGIVKSCGGMMHISSAPGKGTSVEVYFPVAEEISEDDVQLNNGDAPNAGTGRILVVDDEEPITRLVKTMLSRLGYEVSVYTKSRLALEHFGTHHADYDLVISDMNMPEMDGLDFINGIRQIRGDVPVIVCTGFSDRLDEEKCSLLGINGYIVKPIRKKVIGRAVEDVLAGKLVGVPESID